MKQISIILVLALVLSVPALALDDSYSVAPDTTSSSLSILDTPAPDIAELISEDEFNAIADSGDFTFYFGAWLYGGIWYDAIFGTDGTTNLIASLRRSSDGVNGQYVVPPGGSSSGDLFRVSASSTQYSYNTFIPVGTVLNSLIQNDSSVMSAIASVSSTPPLSNHTFGLDYWMGASNSWIIHTGLGASETLSGTGLLSLLTFQNVFDHNVANSFWSLLPSLNDHLISYLYLSSGLPFLFPDGLTANSTADYSLASIVNYGNCGLATILRGVSGSSVTIGSQTSSDLLSALDSLGYVVFRDGVPYTIHGSPQDSLSGILAGISDELFDNVSSRSTSLYSFDDSYNLVTSSVSSSSLASLLSSSLGAIQRDTAQIRAVQASDEDVEFKQSTVDVVDAVKDDWAGSGSASGLKPSDSHALSGYQQDLSGIFSTDVSSIGDGLNLLKDGKSWSTWMTQGVADSLDTVNRPLPVSSEGSIFNIPDIDMSDSTVHSPSGMAFDDLLGGD